ncbi:hypothetical protein FRC01_004017, partial [Tulasnella sp. 417]
MEHHLEARLRFDIFYFSQSYCGIPAGSRATVLIEILPAAFQMDETLFLKRRREDRNTVGSSVIAAMGGMSAQILIKNNEKANEAAMAEVRADKLREVTAGHDGTWITHPLIRKIAMDIFDEHMYRPNQYHIRCEEVEDTGKTTTPEYIDAFIKSTAPAEPTVCTSIYSLVPALINAIRKALGSTLPMLEKLLSRIEMTDDAATLRNIPRFRGMALMADILQEYGDEPELNIT